MGYSEPQAQPTALDTLATNPVGWSSMTPPQFASNASPFFNPMLEPGDMTRNQRIGAMLTSGSRGRPPLATDLPELTEAGDRFFDNAMTVAGATQPIGIRAFHGSPHTFDRFSMDKIGTGEGAQAYGHGLYFAGNEGVARGYRDALNQRSGFRGLGFDVELGGKPLNEKGLPSDWVSAILDIKDAGDIERAWRQVPMLYKEKKVPEIRAIIDQIREQGVVFKPSGSMYEVSLRTSPDRLLDWDKPLSAQPIEVRNIADTLARIPPQGLAPKSINTGADVYNSMRNPRAAKELGFKNWSSSGPAQYLKDTGLDGIQYLDAGSRAAGDGSRNYVMFRDDIIDILRRYGLFGLGMMGTAGVAAGGEEQ